MKKTAPSSKRSWPLSASTRAFLQEGRRTAGYSLYDALHGYIYARWPYLYIGIGTGEHPLAKRLVPLLAAILRQLPRADHPSHDLRTHSATIPSHSVADGYHGKVVPLSAATQLVTVNEPLSLPNLEQVIPYVRARDIILQNPDHIIALECPCRLSRPNPCLPLDVCLIVGEPFASFVAEHHPDRTRWITSREAVEILQAEDQRGHVHHAFFKDAMLGRFYAICNCCACCCGAMQAQRSGTPMLAASGYVSQVDRDLCIGCGNCVETCQFEAISIPDGYALIDAKACMGCGICVERCEQGALVLERDISKGEPLEVFSLLENLKPA
jgi:ferredoxin